MSFKFIVFAICLVIAATSAFPADTAQGDEKANGQEVVAVVDTGVSNDAAETQSEGDTDLKGANTLYYGGLGLGYPYYGGYYGGYYPQRIGYGGYYGGYPGGFGGGYPGGFGGYHGGFGGGYYPPHHHGFGRRSGFGGFYY